MQHLDGAIPRFACPCSVAGRDGTSRATGTGDGSMSTTPPTDAELVAAFTAEADEAVTAADFMRRRANAFHGRPAPPKLRLTRLAPILAVALIIAVAAIVAVF